MTLKAVIFGSIGSFSETSRIQLESFNEALLQNGLKQHWDEKEYIEFLKIQGLSLIHISEPTRQERM